MKRRLPLIVIACLGGAALRAAEDVPPAPEGFLSDQTSLFSEEHAGQISRALAGLHDSAGVSVYVATFSFLGTDSTREQVTPLVDAWLGSRPGVVLAFNRGNARPAIVPSPGLWEKYPTDEVALMMNDAMTHMANVSQPPEDRMSTAISLVIDRLQKMESARMAGRGWFTATDAMLAAGVVLALVLPVGAWWLAFLRRRRREGAPCHFPDVQVGARLGAQFGGGVVGISETPPR